MDPREVFVKFSYLFHTLRYLKPRQGYALLTNRLLPHSSVSLNNLPRMGVLPERWLTSLTKRDSFQPPDTFFFLNEVCRFSSSKLWSTGASSYLWHYNLHYFDYLLSPVGRQQPVHISAWVDRWIVDNTPFSSRGWEPYPMSLRIVNWIKFFWECQSPTETQAASLALQARLLRSRLEYHLFANHLFTNAKALVFSGIALDGDEAHEWLKTGLKILLREIPEQFLTDGGQFERCPMYHGIFLEDLLDLYNLLRKNSLTVARYSEETQADFHQLLDIIEHKWESLWLWYEKMRHPDGRFPLFNDSAYEISPDFESIRDYANRLGFSTPEAVAISLPTIWHAPHSKFVRIDSQRVRVFWDIGGAKPDYQPGHSHAGTLGIELSLDGQRMIVDTGVSTYDVSPRRLLERSTKAHNTLCVDGFNSSEVWSSFRVARRARTLNYSERFASDTAEAICAHDGYTRFPLLGLHQRKLCLEADKFTIIDHIEGKHEHTLEARFIFAPGFRVEIHRNNRTASIISPQNVVCCEIQVNGALLIQESCKHSPEFGKEIPVVSLIACAKVSLPHSIETSFLI